MEETALTKVQEFADTTTIGPLTGDDFLRYFRASECDVTAAYPIDQANNRTWTLLIKPKSKALVEGFGLLREVLVHVSMHKNFQARTLNNRNFVTSRVVEGRIQEDLEIVVSDDSNLVDMVAGQPQDHRVIVPLSSGDIQSDIQSGKPSENFRRRLQEKLYAADFFDRSGPVEGKDFIGRQMLLQDITQNLAKGSHIGLFGLRKTGKTSIIKALVGRAARLAPDMKWIHIDLLSIPKVNHTATSLYHRIAEGAAAVFPREYLAEVGCRVIGQNRRLDDIVGSSEQSRAYERAFDSDFQALLSRLAKDQERLVVVFDEIEQLFPLEGQFEGFVGYDTFLQHMRGLAQQKSSLSLLVVGVNAHISEVTFFGARNANHVAGTRRQNPMFAFFSSRYAPPMTIDEIKTMLRTLGKSSGVTFAHDAVEKIQELVGGHPYLIRKYCSLLIRDVSRPVEISSEDVIGKRKEFIRQENSVFAEMCAVVKEYYPDEFKVLHRVAVEGGCPVESINDTILAHLQGCQLIAIQDGRAEIGTELMKEWLQAVPRRDAIRVGETSRGGGDIAAAAASVEEGDLEKSVKACETTLRRLVRSEMDKRWGGRADERIRMAIGQTSEAKAKTSMEVSLQRYYPEADNFTKEFLDYLYIGDLMKVILGNEWEIFRRVFKSKADTQHNLNVVASCRSEVQHFRELPDKERLRAFLAIRDLLDEIAEAGGIE